MIYTVSWTLVAQEQLAEVWLASKRRNAVTAASYEIERILRDNPDLVGRHRFDTLREFLSPPLGIEFEVIEADRIVHVLSVWELP
jgi:hypothetical protein